MAKTANQKPHTHYHKDGSLWARGQVNAKDQPVGYWEWFRKDGTKLRSGHFDEQGRQNGQWITYDKTGKEYKVTNLKPK